MVELKGSEVTTEVTGLLGLHGVPYFSGLSEEVLEEIRSAINFHKPCSLLLVGINSSLTRLLGFREFFQEFPPNRNFLIDAQRV